MNADQVKEVESTLAATMDRLGEAGMHCYKITVTIVPKESGRYKTISRDEDGNITANAGAH